MDDFITMVEAARLLALGHGHKGESYTAPVAESRTEIHPELLVEMRSL